MKSIALEAALQEFEADQVLNGKSQRTIVEHVREMRRVDRWLKEAGFNWQTVTYKQLKAYTHRKAHLSFSSRSNMLCTLRVFYAWAVMEEYVSSSPAVAFKTPRRPKPVPRSLKTADVQRVMAWLAKQEGRMARRDEVLILVGIYVGLRAAELAAARWSDVDFVEWSITIRLSKMGRGRTLPIHPAIRPMLLRWFEVQGFGLNSPVFAMQEDKPIRPNQINRIARRVAQHSGVTFTPHMLRHTFATVLLKKCKDIYTVSKALGHAHIVQTEIYLSSHAEDLRDGMDKLPDVGSW